MTKKELFAILRNADIETAHGGYCARFEDADDFARARKALAAVGSLVEKNRTCSCLPRFRRRGC